MLDGADSAPRQAGTVRMHDCTKQPPRVRLKLPSASPSVLADSTPLSWATRAWRRLQRSAPVLPPAPMMLHVNRDARVLRANAAAVRLTGMDERQLRAQSIAELLCSFSDDSARVSETMRACIKGRQRVRLPQPIAWHGPGDRHYALELTALPVHADGADAVLVFTEMSATPQLQHGTAHDPHTGLPPPALLLDRLRQALTSAQRRGTLVAVLRIELDGLAPAHTPSGPPPCAHTLHAVSAQLQAGMRSGDTIAHWRDTELIILMENLADRNAVLTVTRKLLQLLARACAPTEDRPQPLPFNIGISVGPSDSTDGETLLAMADQALYRGKLDGGGSPGFHCPALNTCALERRGVDAALPDALTRGEFELFYQPQLHIASARLAGFEALLRWRRPGHGVLAADTFLAAAEASGLIRSLGEWAIIDALSQAARWEREGLLSVPLALKLSARQCADLSLVDSLRRALADSGIAPAMLKVEVNAAHMMRATRDATTVLQAIHRLGVSVAVEGYGTGDSSLACLQRVPVTELKIDPHCVQDIDRKAHARSKGSDETKASADTAIVRGAIALGHGLGMAVVAEGVETQAQLRFLAAHGCTLAQGPLFAHALPAAEARDWLCGPPPHAQHALRMLSGSHPLPT